jgi:hypothetical protein
MPEHFEGEAMQQAQKRHPQAISQIRSAKHWDPLTPTPSEALQASAK